MKRKFDYILEDVYRELINAICANDGSKILSLITDYPELIDKVNQGWYEPLFLAVKLCDSSIFKIIKKAKINLSVVDKGGENVLHLAINNNRLDIIKYLLSIEQDLELLNTKDNDGHTALHIAVEVGNLEIIKLLLDAGADITAVNDDGEDVLYIATNSNALDIVKYLLSIPQILDLLNVQNKETALHLAARDNNLKMLQLMVGAGADITAVNDDGENVLHIVARIKELNFAEYIITRNGTIDQDIEKITANRDKALDIVKYLLMQGLIINKSDKYIKTVNDLIGISEDIMKIAQNEKPEKFVGNYSSQENLNFAAIFFTERFKTGTIKYDSFSDIEKRISDNDLLNKQENLLLKNVLTARIAELTKDVINLLYMIEHEIISIDPSSTNQKSNYTKLLSQKYNSNDSTLDQEKDIESSLIISLIAMFNGKEDGINPLAQTMSLTDIEIKTLQGKNSPVDNIYITTMINLKQNILNLQKYLLPSNKICSAFNNVINSYNKVQDTEFTCIASQDTPIEYSSMLIGIESHDSAR